MLLLLQKLFIKDYRNVEKKEVRASYGRLSGLIGIVSNFFLFGIKLFAGILSGSISIIGDSINNLSDMGSSIVSLIGFKMSSKPADKEHPFGHERIEYIIGLIISVIILLIGGQFLYNSILKIFNPTELNVTTISLVILVVSIFIKLWQSAAYNKMSKLINSLSIKALSIDSRNDCLTTLVVLVGCVINIAFELNLDGYFGAIISVFVLVSGISLVKQTSSILIGEGIKQETIDCIIEDIKKYDMVLGVHDVVCHSYGPTKTYMSLHVEVPAKGDILVIHDQIDEIETDMAKKYKIEIVIHMDPIESDNEEVMELNKYFSALLHEIDEQLSLHDFRVVNRLTKKNIIFDVTVPFGFPMSDDEILRSLKDKIKDKEKYSLVINFENGY